MFAVHICQTNAKYVQEPTTLEGGRARLTEREDQSWHTSKQDVPFQHRFFKHAETVAIDKGTNADIIAK